jgi:hypothetical protein
VAAHLAGIVKLLAFKDKPWRVRAQDVSGNHAPTIPVHPVLWVRASRAEGSAGQPRRYCRVPDVAVGRRLSRLPGSLRP